ncbi:MAG: PAS domain S-box protein [Bdellovibrionales bacterium]|nr:PAS domain S-box protein [Bdellovibrionales bacterium]
MNQRSAPPSLKNPVPSPSGVASIREYFEFSNDMYCEVDNTGQFIYVNHAWQISMGLEPDDMVGHSFVEFIHPDDLADTVEAFQKDLAFSHTFINRYKNKSGRYQYLEWTGFFDKKAQRGYSHAREVTKQHRGRRLLTIVKELQDKYIQFSYNGDMLFAQILNSVLEMTEARAAVLFDTSEQTAATIGNAFAHVGLSDAELSSLQHTKSSDTQPSLQHLARETLRLDKPLIYNSRPSREAPFQSYVGVPLYFGSKLAGLLVVLDRTDGFKMELIEELSVLIESMAAIVGMHRATQRERELQERFRAIADHLPVMLAEYNRNFDFKWTNLTFSQLIGRTAKDLRQHDAPTMLFEDPVQRREAMSFLLSGSSEWREFKVRTRQNQRLDTLWYCVELTDGSYVGIALDISDRKAAEAALIQSSKMASLGEMSAGVSHEINNPLTIIQGSSFHALHNLQKDKMNLGEVETDLHCIIQNCDRIARIVRGLRAFSRNVEHEPFTPTPIAVIIEDVLDLAKERFRNNQIELIVELEYADLIDCRPIQIAQVLMNLLNNSYDAVYGKRDASVAIRCLQSPSAKDWVRIEVSDSGPGIPLEIQQKIMDPFFTTKEVGKGTGLGLSISKGIIESHRGRLSFDNQAKLTTFVIEIPKKQDRA